MRISQRQNYHRESFVGTSYLFIMTAISIFLGSYVEHIERDRGDYIELAYQVRTNSFISKYILISYLLKFPMFSYKYKATFVFSNLIKSTLNKDYRNSEGLSAMSALKKEMICTKEEHLSHLSNFYKL
jgi:hypothetical protein